jgi:hypothetical protein
MQHVSRRVRHSAHDRPGPESARGTAEGNRRAHERSAAGSAAPCPAPRRTVLNDVLAHLRSCGDMWGQYMARIVAEDHPTIRAMSPPDMDQEDELSRARIRALVPRLRSSELLALLRPLPQAAWSRSGTVTGAGRQREMTVLDYARWLANHERSHVKQMARILELPRLTS